MKGKELTKREKVTISAKQKQKNDRNGQNSDTTTISMFFASPFPDSNHSDPIRQNVIKKTVKMMQIERKEETVSNHEI